MIATSLSYLEAIFGWLLSASWQAAVLALLVLLVQTILRGRLNPRWRYALWLLVLARLVLPVLPESALSLFQFAPPPPPSLVTPVTTALFVEASASLPSIPLSNSTTLPEPAHPFSLYSLLALIWLTGAAFLFLLTWQVNRRFARQVDASPEITDPELRALFAQAQAELGLRRSIRLIESPHVQSPAIMGLFSPTLLLPANVRTEFDHTELRLIFLHELAHLKRGDVIVQGLIALLQILHWFNPILWFAFRRMRADREPATDALVLSRAGESEKERYGLMLIKLLENFNQRHSLPTLVGILEDKDQFKRRFSLIARFTRGAYGWSLLGVLLIAILAVACLTKKATAQAVAGDPEFVFSTELLTFKLDPADPTRAAQYREVLKSRSMGNLGKVGGFVSLGTAGGGTIHLSEPNSFWQLATTFRLKDDSVDYTLYPRLVNPTTVEITARLEPKDAKGLGLGPISGTWTQPIGSNGVLLLSLGEQTLIAPQADGSKLACLALVSVRKGPVVVGEKLFKASDKISEVNLSQVPANANARSLTTKANSHMLEAVQKGDMAALQKLFDQGLDPDAAQSNPVYWAVSYHQPEILKLLLAHDADATRNGSGDNESPLDLARRLHPDLVPILQEGMESNRPMHIAQLKARVDSIHIDQLTFKDTPLTDVIATLQTKTKQADPTGQGLSFVLRTTPSTPAKPADLPPATLTLKLSNVSLTGALDVIAVVAKLHYSVEEYAIYLRPSVDGDEPVTTVRTFLVPAGFFKTHPGTTVDVKQELLDRGIEFPGNAMATLLPGPGKLIVRNTPTQLDKIQTLLDALSTSNPAASSFPQPTPFENNLYEKRIHDLKVWEMPLPGFTKKITDEIRQNDPEKKGLSLELKLPPGEPPVDISIGYPPESWDLVNLLEKLQDLYPLRYEIGESSVTLRQLSKPEIALRQKSQDTKLDLNLSSTEAVAALQAVQRAAQAKGFDFDLDCSKVPTQPSRPITLNVKGWSVEQALLSICYQGDLIKTPSPDFKGYQIAPGSEDELHDRVDLKIGISFWARPAEGPANPLETLPGDTNGPSIITPAYPHPYHGKKVELGGDFGYPLSNTPDPLTISFKYKPVILDKSHIQMTGTVEIKNAQGASLGQVTGQWTAASGANVRLLSNDGKPLSVTLSDGKKWVVLLRLQTLFVDPESKAKALLPSSDEVKAISLTETTPDQPGQSISPIDPSSIPAKKNILTALYWLSDDSPYSPPTPFYVALPFNDLAHPDLAKTWVPSSWVKPTPANEPLSSCIGHWIKLTNEAGVSCYAQWEDFGPWSDDDATYVFGDDHYKGSTGITLSPATAQFLGTVAKAGATLGAKSPAVSWQFVDVKDVPPGPWFSDRIVSTLPDPTPLPMGLSSPPSSAKPIAPGDEVRTEARVAYLSEDDYQAHRADVDAAVQKGDLASLAKLKSYHQVSDLPVLGKPGEQGVIEQVRVLPYPISLERDAKGHLAPNDFKRKNLGVRFVFRPTVVDDKIKIIGYLDLSSLERWEPLGEDAYKPVLHTHMVMVSGSFVPGQTGGLQLPGGPQLEPTDPAFVFTPDKILDASKNPKILRRTFLFLNVRGDTLVLNKPSPDSFPIPPPTPLQKAIAADDADKVKTLLDQKADVYALDMPQVLSEHENRVVKLLWDHGEHRCSALTYAISQGATAADVEALLKKGASVAPPEDEFISPLAVAATNGNFSVVRLLVEHGADPNWHGRISAPFYEPVDCAATWGHPDILAYLLQHGAKATPMILASSMCMRGGDAGRPHAEDYRKINSLLIDAGALDNLSEGNAAMLLIVAASNAQDPVMLRQLLDHGLSPEAKSEDPQFHGKSALESVRQWYDTRATQPWNAGIKPLLDILEAADKKAGNAPNSTETDAPSPSRAQAEFDRKASQIMVNIDFGRKSVNDVLKSIQADAARQGFTFSLDLSKLDPQTPPSIHNYGHSASVDNALQIIRDDVGLKVEPLPNGQGYRISYDELRHNALQTYIDVDFKNVDAITALKAVQSKAAQQGFSFDLDLTALNELPDLPLNAKDTDVTVAETITSICQNTNLSALPLENARGYRIVVNDPFITGGSAPGQLITPEGTFDIRPESLQAFNIGNPKEPVQFRYDKGVLSLVRKPLVGNLDLRIGHRGWKVYVDSSKVVWAYNGKGYIKRLRFQSHEFDQEIIEYIDYGPSSGDQDKTLWAQAPGRFLALIGKNRAGQDVPPHSPTPEETDPDPP